MKKIAVLLFLVIAGIAFIQCETKDTPRRKPIECIPQNLPEGMPSWTACPQQYGVKTYGAGGWVYGAAFSHKTANESLARRRARENVQIAIAEGIAYDITEKISSEEISFLKSLKIKNPQTAVSNSITLRLPAYEVLEWYIEKGKEKTPGKVQEEALEKEQEENQDKVQENNNNHNYFIAHILVRFPTGDFLDTFSRIDPEKVIDRVLKNEKIKEGSISAKDRAKFVDILKARIDEGKKKYME